MVPWHAHLVCLRADTALVCTPARFHFLLRLIIGAEGHRVSFVVKAIDGGRGVCEQGRSQRGLSERVCDADPRVSVYKRRRDAISRITDVVRESS